jgi:hypothetical protein
LNASSNTVFTFLVVAIDTTLELTLATKCTSFQKLNIHAPILKESVVGFAGTIFTQLSIADQWLSRIS